jgi:hypothetical protein
MSSDIVEVEAVLVTVQVRVCSEPGCLKRSVSRGLCQAHYRRLLRKGHTAATNLVAKGKQCVCGKPVLSKLLCRGCYEQMLVARRPSRNPDTLCVKGGPDFRPTPEPGFVRFMLCGDEGCLEPWHASSWPEGSPVPDGGLLVVRNRQLVSVLRSGDSWA